MISLGIDPSTKTGIALVDSTEGVTHSEVIKVPTKFRAIRRAVFINDAIIDIIHGYSPDIVNIEGYSLHSKFNLATMVEIGTIIRLGLHITLDGYYEIPPTSLKKYVSGKGNSPKDVMILECYKRFGFETASNDIADAVGLAYFGLAKEGCDIATLPQVNMAALTKVEFVKSDF